MTYTLKLDNYERDNLLWLVKTAIHFGLDTGDWCKQVRYALEQIGADETKANWPPEMTERHVAGYEQLRARQPALELTGEEKEALRFAVELLGANPLVHQQHDPVVAEHTRRCNAALAVLSRLCGGEP